MSGPRFLADESCDFALVSALRGEGHDVLAVAEATARGDLCAAVSRVIRSHGEKLAGSFVVIQPGQLRVRRLQA